MFPRLGSSKLVSTWITITLVASIFAVVDGGLLDEWVSFSPSRVWRGEIWRLGTWVFVEAGPLSLLVTCACIYKFGGELVPRWGEPRLRRFMVEVLGGAAIATTLLALVSADVWRAHQLGGWSVGNALVIAWARQFPQRPLAFYGLVVLSGRSLIAAIVVINVVYALFRGPFAMALELFVCAGACWYPTERLARRT